MDHGPGDGRRSDLSGRPGSRQFGEAGSAPGVAPLRRIVGARGLHRLVHHITRRAEARCDERPPRPHWAAALLRYGVWHCRASHPRPPLELGAVGRVRLAVPSLPEAEPRAGRVGGTLDWVAWTSAARAEAHHVRWPLWYCRAPERSETLATRHVSPAACRHSDRVHGVRRCARGRLVRSASDKRKTPSELLRAVSHSAAVP